MPLDSRQQATLQRAAELALSYLGSLDAAPVCSTAPLAELRRRFSLPLLDEGVDPVTVIDELARAADGGLLGNAGGRF
ncbi:MAG: aspartate aminotransferase family protein, partial [Gemmatimonadota bacterium]|nr:aspartate aminotransferase family protein [Gemmatimonadota bacterium]